MTHDFLKNEEATTQMLSLFQNPPFPQSLEAFCPQADAASTFDALDGLRHIGVPTLVLVGEQDLLTPPWAARELAEGIPGSELRIIANGAHGFIWEIPERVNKEVVEFLIRTEALQPATRRGESVS
ncbi:MAG: alpha/beta hydrolase [Deltaproteobacteria bacterium]|nr:alpha/beta hydrolase [Deltaproteobacteria bacterium]